MNHVTEDQLNEFLDHALDASARETIQSHLEACSECRARWEQLSRLDSTLLGLSELELPRDLTPSILARLPQSASRNRTRFFAAQVGAALGMLLFMIYESAQFIRIPSLAELPSPLADFSFTISQIRFPTHDLKWLMPEFQIPSFASLLSAFHFPFPVYGIPAPDIAFIAASVLALCLIGNVVLLHEPPEVRR